MAFFSDRKYRHMSATERKYAMMAEAVPAGFKMGGNVSGKALHAGMKVLAYYNSTNEGIDVVEILGVTGNEVQHGEGGVKFLSVAECLKFHHAKTLAQLEAMDSDSDSSRGGWGFHTYLMVRDMNHTNPVYDESGPWYYLFDGRWARGSGAEKLSFVELLPIEEPVKPSRFALMEN